MPVQDTTLSGLKARISLWSGRSDTDFTNELPTFIASAEQRVYYGALEGLPSDPVRVREMETIADLVLVDGKAPLTDPLYLEMIAINNDSDFQKALQQITLQQVNSNASISTVPTAFANEQLNVKTAEADGAGTLNVVYYARFDALVADASSNWFLQNVPDLFFNAAMISVNQFVRNQELMGTYYQAYLGSANGLAGFARQQRQSPGPLAPVIPGVGFDRRIGHGAG